MARKEKSSPSFDKLEQRLTGMKSIEEKLDLGGGISVDAIQQKMTLFSKELQEYNIMLKNIDSKLRRIEDLETEANSLSEQILLTVAAKYSKDSDEYALAGGTRKSDIKRRMAYKPVKDENGE